MGTSQLLVHNTCNAVRKARGYTFTLNQNGRPTEIHVKKLKLYGKHKRPGAQEKALVRDLQPDDHYGHFAGHQFNAPAAHYNLTGQNSWANEYQDSPWWQMEERWRQQLLIKPDSVEVTWEITYPPGSHRPSSVKFIQIIDGVERVDEYNRW